MTISFAKREMRRGVSERHYETFQDVVDRLPRFLDRVCNEKRLQLALGYLSPMDLEAQHARRVA